MRIYLCLITALYFSLNSTLVYAENESSTEAIVENTDNIELSAEEKENIFITEFMPDPQEGNEWVEIYNNNEDTVTLTDWYIDDVVEGGATPIKFSVELSSKTYTIVEIDKSLLNNSSDSATLLDNNKNVIHSVSYKKTVKGYSIQKLEDKNWYITEQTTPNNPPFILPTKEAPQPDYENAEDSEVIKTGENSENINYEEKTFLTLEQKKNVLISEFMPNPIEENEWVEIFNANNETVYLENWFIDDTLNSGGSPFKFTLSVEPESYAIVEISKSLLNNSNDEVSLLDENSKPLYTVKYKKTIKGNSIQKLSNNKWYITKDNTKNEKNAEYVEPEKIDLDTIEEEVSEMTSYTNIPESILTTLNVENLETGKILGITEYKKVPFYKAEKPFTIESAGKVYILTEKDLPNFWQQLYTFFEKAFW